MPETISGDALWRMRVYRLSLKIGDEAWEDVTRLVRDGRTASLSNQLYRAVGSVGANLAEGYSRSSFRDRAHFFEYALGSAREARDWYYKGRHVLGEETTAARLAELTEVIRLLLTIIPAERGRTFHDEQPQYNADDAVETSSDID